MKVRNRQTYFAVSLFVSDIFMILVALHAAFWVRFTSGIVPSSMGVPDDQAYRQTFGLVVIIMVVSYRAYSLYVEERVLAFMDELSLVLKASTVTLLLLLALSFFYRGFEFSRGYLLVIWFFIPAFVLAARTLLGYAYMAYRRANNKFKESIVVGANHDSIKFAHRNAAEPRLCARVVGVIDSRLPKGSSYKRLPVIGHLSELDQILTAHPNINEVVVTDPALEHRDIMRVLVTCEKHLVAFKWSPDILGLMATQMRVKYELGLPLLSVRESPLLEWENRLIKRTVDMALSLAGLVLMAPVLAVIAVWVTRDSKGPIFYRQERVGEDGKSFDLYKFRTMRVGAEAATGPVWTVENDDRRTRIGGFLRRFNLDELPQLWNVFKGDMSLVGPRPERPHFVGQFRESIPRYMGRHRIKSGITGWAQVNGLRGNTSIEERTKYDLYYIENWSVFLDAKILFKTFFAFKNAY
jgi:exopolysaccharide biosynthesis polyprenyl glycosylphosphotransferase